MNTDIQKYKKLLEEERATLESELGSLGVKNPADGDWEATPTATEDGETSGEDDLADRNEEYEERSATLKTLGKRLDDVHSALMKIEQGAYGVCEVSGEAIEEDRLLANPAARTCMKHMM